MLLLRDFNIPLYEYVTDRERKISRRYMSYIYRTISDYTIYSEFEERINNANEKLYRRILNKKYQEMLDKELKQ